MASSSSSSSFSSSSSSSSNLVDSCGRRGSDVLAKEGTDKDPLWGTRELFSAPRRLDRGPSSSSSFSSSWANVEGSAVGWCRSVDNKGEYCKSPSTLATIINPAALPTERSCEEGEGGGDVYAGGGGGGGEEESAPPNGAASCSRYGKSEGYNGVGELPTDVGKSGECKGEEGEWPSCSGGGGECQDVCGGYSGGVPL